MIKLRHIYDADRYAAWVNPAYISYIEPYAPDQAEVGIDGAKVLRVGHTVDEIVQMIREWESSDERMAGRMFDPEEVAHG